MPIRGAGFTRNASGCIAVLVLTAVAFDSPRAVGADGPDIAPQRMSPEGTLVDPLSMILLVDNVARLRESELEAAQALASAIFRTAGLEPTWVDCRAPTHAGTQMWVVLGSADRSERMIARLQGPADLLGMAPPGSGRVYIFPQRIRHYAALKKRSFEEVLGHVLAHEVGHHLLPEGGHADTGIMRADIGDAFSTPWFTRLQFRSIHNSLSDAQARVRKGPVESRRAPGR
jgi:hypothetical protein